MTRISYCECGLAKAAPHHEACPRCLSLDGIKAMERKSGQGRAPTVKRDIISELRVSGLVGVTVDDLVRTLGQNQSTVRRALWALLDEGRIRRIEEEGNILLPENQRRYSYRLT